MVTFLVCLVVVGGAVVLIVRVTLADVAKPATVEAEPHGGVAPRALADAAKQATTFLIPTGDAGRARRSRSKTIVIAPDRRAAAFLIPTGTVTARPRHEPPSPGGDTPSGPSSSDGPSLDGQVAAARAREAERVADAERIVAADAERLARAARSAAAAREAAAERVAEGGRVAAALQAAADRVAAVERAAALQADREVEDERAEAEADRLRRLDEVTIAGVPAVPVHRYGRADLVEPIDEPIVWREGPAAGGAETMPVAAVTATATAWSARSTAVGLEGARTSGGPRTPTRRAAPPTFARRVLARLAGAVKLIVLLVVVGTALALLLGVAVVLVTFGVRAAIGS